MFKGRNRFLILFLIICLAGVGCASNTGKYGGGGAAGGAAIGALAGQALGGNTATTLMGAGAGAVAGAIGGMIYGTGKDKKETQAQINQQQQYQSVQTQGTTMQAPPGQWVKISGQWINGVWVPEHLEWRAVQP